MSPLFIAGHPAIDFLNTALTPQGQPIELIGDGESFIAWLGGVGLLSEQEVASVKRRFGLKRLGSVADEARRVREWARDWLARWRVAPDDDYAKEIRALNGLLAQENRVREVVALDDGFSLMERSRIDSPEALISLIAAQIAALVTTEQPTLVRHCEGQGCTLWFLDRTKGHRRLFCSASACGNRAKVAAFRERQRAQD